MNKKIIRFLVIVIGVIVIIAAANITMRNLVVSKVIIEINYRSSDHIIVRKDIERLIVSRFGNIDRKKRKEIDVEEIEKYLGSQNMIETANVFLTLTGKLYIKIEQNIPLLRIYCVDGKEFYIDYNAEVCNTRKGRAANVLVVNGDFEEKLEAGKVIDSTREPVTYNVYKIARNLASREILANQIDQIYYSKNDGFELLPKVGDYVISLGGMNDLDKKLNKLVYLYKDGFMKYGWDEYSHIDLQFKNQAICTKK